MFRLLLLFINIDFFIVKQKSGNKPSTVYGYHNGRLFTLHATVYKHQYAHFLVISTFTW